MTNIIKKENNNNIGSQYTNFYQSNFQLERQKKLILVFFQKYHPRCLFSLFFYQKSFSYQYLILLSSSILCSFNRFCQVYIVNIISFYIIEVDDMQSGNSHLFMDISTISYKDTNISFSVENLLNSEYYPSKAQRPEQKSDKNKNKEKGTKTISDKNKKDAPTTPRKTSNCALKDIKRSKRQMSKKQEVLEQRDTQDNSQTVKKVTNKSNHKQMLIKNVAKSIESIGVVKSNLSSNKFQPKLEGHYRTKSNGSFKKTKSGGTFNCRSDFQGKAISSNISLKHNQSNSKQRSGTIREITDDAKIKNQNIVRNDYFEETQKNGRVLSKNIGNIIRQRSLSASKKDIKGLKKPKKIDQIIPTTITSNEKFNPRSPKLRKK